jgi:hypothetical protein
MRLQHSDRKLAELILFISLRSEGDERFGATKLNKLLFFSDFSAYLLFAKSITGQLYQRLPQGPAPRRLIPVREALVANRDLAIRKVEYFNKTQNRTFALREPRLSEFSAEQISLVTDIIEDNWEKNATDVSYRSHRFHGWEDAADGETIPYEVALLSKRRPSSGERKRSLKDVPLATKALAGKVKVLPVDA